MQRDFDMITYKFPTDWDYVNLYPIACVHVGSPDFIEELWYKWKKTVMDDPKSGIILVGDIVDNGLKTSKTDSYRAILSPREQKRWITDELRPLADKILAGVEGNHEYRSVVSADDSPLYDIMCKLDREDLFRENMGFLKVSVGRKSADRQWAYGLALAHGTGKGKQEKFRYSIDNMDLFVTAHLHQAGLEFPAKYVMDLHNETVRKVGFKHLSLSSFTDGGYALKGMYAPQDNVFPIVKLSGKEKEVDIRWK